MSEGSGSDATGGASTGADSEDLEAVVGAHFEAISELDAALCDCGVDGGASVDECLAQRELEYPIARRECHEEVYLELGGAELIEYLTCLTAHDLELSDCLRSADCSSSPTDAIFACVDMVGIPTCGMPPQPVFDEIQSRCPGP